MKCLIIDDNKIARTVLKHLVSELDFVQLIGECEDVMQASNILNTQTIDLIFLDVEMPKISGLEFLKTQTVNPLVIMVTSKPDYALEAFDYNVVDFILKPIKHERFLKAILRAKESFDSRSKQIEFDKEYFFIKEKGKSSKLMIDSILYVQALGDYVTIHTSNKKYTIHYTLSAIENELPKKKFMRIHRSFIVAIDKIDTLEENTVYISHNAIPVGDSQRNTLLKRLNLL